MDFEDDTISSAPTMGPNGGCRAKIEYAEPSFGSMPTMMPGESLSLGTIDQYELVRKLGGGGFGVVYLARDTVSGIEVAIKTLHPLLKSDAEEMERLREKFALIHGLTHPNIAKALVLHPVREIAIADDEARRELRLSPGDSVMVMDYAPGTTLSQWRRQFKGGANSPSEPRVPLPLALEIGRQIASALDYAHSERIVHRDIKPPNVVVETLSPQPHSEAIPGLRVRILDFGLAAAIRSSMSRVSSETGDISGTRPYMAPEQWLGRKQDGRTDQYALACVLYELLSGEPPFAGVFETGDPIIMRTAVERDAPDEIGDVPPAVNASLLKALFKNPKERFSSCSEFVAALGGASKGGASTPCEPTLQSRPLARLEVSPHHVPDSAAHEVEVIRRKLSLSRALKGIPEADRADTEFLKFISTAEDEMAVAEEAIKLDKFAAAAVSLDNAESALDELQKVRFAREETARKAKEEAERSANEKAEAKRKAREEEARKARANHGGVQLWAGGPYWAETNIGATKPEDCGLYFWWGDTVGYRREGNAWAASDDSSQHFSFDDWNTPTYDKDYATLWREGWTTSAGVLVPEHDAAQVHWGGGWRIPTDQEHLDLQSKCDWTWMTMDGVKGYVVRGRGAYAGASIFLPAVGNGHKASLRSIGSYGYYWSSAPDSINNCSSTLRFNACFLRFNSYHHGTYYNGSRSNGFPVRPVLETAK